MLHQPGKCAPAYELLEWPHGHAQVQCRSRLDTLSGDFSGALCSLKRLWVRASQGLNYVAWERGSVSPTRSAQVAPLFPPDELDLPHNAGFHCTQECRRAGNLAPLCRTFSLLRAWVDLGIWALPCCDQSCRETREPTEADFGVPLAWFGGMKVQESHIKLGFWGLCVPVKLWSGSLTGKC